MPIIGAVNCLQRSASWNNLVREKGKRESPIAPPGLRPLPRIGVTYDKGEALGQFINLASSSKLRIRNLANHGSVAQESFTRVPLFSNPDTTQPDLRGACPKMQYVNSARTQDGVAITEINVMSVELLKTLYPDSLLHQPTIIISLRNLWDHAGKKVQPS